MIRVFLKVKSIHYIPDDQGLNYEHEVETTTSLGCLTSGELKTFTHMVNTIDKIKPENSCIEYIKTGTQPFKTGDIFLNIHLSPCIKNCECGAKTKEECPLIFLHGKCQNQMMKDLIGKRFLKSY